MSFIQDKKSINQSEGCHKSEGIMFKAFYSNFVINQILSQREKKFINKNEIPLYIVNP